MHLTMAKQNSDFQFLAFSHRPCRGSEVTMGSEDQLQILLKGIFICSGGVKWKTFLQWPI